MDRVCVTCRKAFYVSPSRSRIKNCSYECNKIWRKNEAISEKSLANCLCGCGSVVKSHRAKYLFGHSPQPKVRRGLFQKGHKQMFFKHSESTKRKMSKIQSGHAPSIKGDAHWNWKGGITEKDKAERSRFHKYFRLKIMQRDNFTCQICDAYGIELQVDHIKKWSDYPELRFDISNCRTVCTPCHYYITFKKKMPQGIAWGKNLSRRIG